jgi:dTDP-4-amino-4,6-dideoxygalactose transaminase
MSASTTKPQQFSRTIPLAAGAVVASDNVVVPVMRPVLPQFELVRRHLEAVHASGWFSNFGPAENGLRERFAVRFGVDPARVMTAANATLALGGCFATAARSRWTIPSFTFTATPAAALMSGVDFRFGDIGADWWLTGEEDDVPVRVAPFGAPPEFSPSPRRHGTIIDAAASIGNPWDPGLLGETDAVVFSLHATKVLGAGEGAIIVFGSTERAQQFSMWTNFGFFGSRESQIAGINAKMSESQAAYVHAALDGWDDERDEWLAARDVVLRVGDEAGLTTFEASRTCITPYWIAVFPDAATTDAVEGTLAEHGIGTRRWWSRGCHRMAAYADVPHGPLPMTEDIAGRYLGLPMFRGLGEREGGLILNALENARSRATAW